MIMMMLVSEVVILGELGCSRLRLHGLCRCGSMRLLPPPDGPLRCNSEVYTWMDRAQYVFGMEVMLDESVRMCYVSMSCLSLCVCVE